MRVVSVYDLASKDAIYAAMDMRKHVQRPKETDDVLREVVAIIGGRLAYIRKVSKAVDMIKHARNMLTVEKAWLLSQIGLAPNCDSDALDEQKWSSCSWLLLREFVKRRKEDEERMKVMIAHGEATDDDLMNLPLPRISYVRACTIGLVTHPCRLLCV